MKQFSVDRFPALLSSICSSGNVLLVEGGGWVVVVEAGDDEVERGAGMFIKPLWEGVNVKGRDEVKGESR